MAATDSIVYVVVHPFSHSSLMSTQYTPTTAVVLQFAEGSVVVELYWSVVPRTCENFAMLVEEGDMNGCVVNCARAASEGLVVCSNPRVAGNIPVVGSRGAPRVDIPAAYVYEGDSVIAGESPSQGELSHSGAGLLTTVPGECGGGFYITLAPHPSLDGSAVVFGRIAAGMSVLSQILRQCASGKEGSAAFVKAAQLVDLPRQRRPHLQ